jgi:hypothetical protein
MPTPKVELIRQAESLRDTAARARRLAATLHQMSEKEDLVRYAEELDARALQIERQASGDTPDAHPDS